MESYDIRITYSSGIHENPIEDITKTSTKYPAKSHARRVAQITGKSGLILLSGTKSAYFSNSDQIIPFRQDRYFYYLSGCNEPDCLLTYDLAKDWLTLYLPPINWNRFYYDGRGSTVEEAMEKYNIDDAKHLRDLEIESIVDQVAPSATKILTLDTCLLTSIEELDTTTLKPALDKCRSVKDQYEIGLIRKANKISAAGHRRVLQQISKLRSEAEAEAIYTEQCIRRLARQQAYIPIFGAGANASTLHYIDNDQPFGKSQILLVDAGCEWQCYASDVTRTIPLNATNPGSWPSEEAKQVYAAVERVQEACIKLMQAGTRFSTVGLAAQSITISELLQLGILTGEAKDIEAAGTVRAFLPHGLGHHVGLEVHDVPPPLQDVSCMNSTIQVFHGARQPLSVGVELPSFHNQAQLRDSPMEPGNVITVEPGIYFNEYILKKNYLSQPKHARHINTDVLRRYMPVGGVRIEDDILITIDGNENLTTAPKGERMLRVIRNNAA